MRVTPMAASSRPKTFATARACLAEEPHPELAQRHLGMQQVVDGQDQQQRAAGDLDIADGDAEDVQAGIAQHQKSYADASGRERGFRRDALPFPSLQLAHEAEVDREDPDDVDGDEQGEEGRQQRRPDAHGELPRARPR
jgi:hypothetical protein